MRKTTNTFFPKIRARMVLDHEGEHPPRWAAALSISAKIGCSAHTLLDWVVHLRYSPDSDRISSGP